MKLTGATLVGRLGDPFGRLFRHRPLLAALFLNALAVPKAEVVRMFSGIDPEAVRLPLSNRNRSWNRTEQVAARFGRREAGAHRIAALFPVCMASERVVE